MQLQWMQMIHYVANLYVHVYSVAIVYVHVSWFTWIFMLEFHSNGPILCFLDHSWTYYLFQILVSISVWKMYCNVYQDKNQIKIMEILKQIGIGAL